MINNETLKMRQITLNIEENRYSLFLQFLQTLDYINIVDANTGSSSIVNQGHKDYDFSDLAGKLQWKGDAVKEQRRLRDEW